MGNSRHLGLFLLAPAALFVILFFLAPVVLTGVFGFTNMSTATGITGGSYMVSASAMRPLRSRYGLDALADQLSQRVYTIDAEGLQAAAEAGGDAAALTELRANFLDESFSSRRDVEAKIKSLNARPSTTRGVKTISAQFERSVVNVRFDTLEELLAAIANFGIDLSDDQIETLGQVTYTGWSFTTQNFKTMVELPDTTKTLINTLFYVFTTLCAGAIDIDSLHAVRPGWLFSFNLAAAKSNTAGSLCADVEMAGLGYRVLVGGSGAAGFCAAQLAVGQPGQRLDVHHSDQRHRWCLDGHADIFLGHQGHSCVVVSRQRGGRCYSSPTDMAHYSAAAALAHSVYHDLPDLVAADLV